MAGKIKGIVVEIGGDTSGLEKALKNVNKTTASLSKELRGINTLLKFDPKNTQLLIQKHEVLEKQITQVGDKLKILKEQEKELSESLDIPELNDKYRALQREIVSAEQKIKNLKTEASNWTYISEKLDRLSQKFTNIGNVVENIGKSLTVVSASTGALITLGVKYNAEIEKAQNSMEAFVGNSEEASDIVDKITKQSKTSPFELTDLIKANQMLITADVNAEKSIETISALADAVALTGGGNDELTRMASNLQQIQNARKSYCNGY